MHIHKIVYINPSNAELNPICHLLALLGAHHIFHVSGLRVKTFKIAPTCFDPKIIFRELHLFLVKVTFLKHSLINSLY